MREGRERENVGLFPGSLLHPHSPSRFLTERVGEKLRHPFRAAKSRHGEGECPQVPWPASVVLLGAPMCLTLAGLSHCLGLAVS